MSRPILLLALCSLSLYANDVALLNLRVTEGEGTVYAAGSRATRGITVEVTDELGHPVQGASVSFHLPDAGPSGTFSSGSRDELQPTGPDGRAAVWGMRWNKTPGTVQVRITAVKGGVRAGMISMQYLDDKVATEPAFSARRRKKILWIAAAVAGAAGAGLVAGGRRGSSTSASAAPPVIPPTIGAPTISIGH